MIIRAVVGLVGGLLILYGAARLVHGLPTAVLVVFTGWLAAVLVISLGVAIPLVLAVGAALRRWVPDRPRTFVQIGLIVASVVVLIAVPLIMRQHTQPPVKAMLLQDYRINLVVLLAIIAIGSAVAYAIRARRDRSSTPARRQESET